MDFYDRRIRFAWYGVGVILIILCLTCGGCGSIPPIIVDGEEDTTQVPGTKRVGIRWTSPCLGTEPPCGGPWEDYLLELKKGQGDWVFELATPDTFASLILQPGTWVARVAARNSSDVVGPWSDESDPFRVKADPDDDIPDIHREENGETP